METKCQDTKMKAERERWKDKKGLNAECYTFTTKLCLVQVNLVFDDDRIGRQSFEIVFNN